MDIKVDTDECWLWAQNVNPNDGYGRVRLEFNGKRYYLAHRLMYEMCIGEIPPTYELDHLCRNHLCINPDHLEPVTHSENVKRGLTPVINRFNAVTRTHCRRGHPWVPENLLISSKATGGKKYCKVCKNERLRERLKGHKEVSLSR